MVRPRCSRPRPLSWAGITTLRPRKPELTRPSQPCTRKQPEDCYLQGVLPRPCLSCLRSIAAVIQALHWPLIVEDQAAGTLLSPPQLRPS